MYHQVTHPSFSTRRYSYIDLLQCREPAVVHVRRGVLDVPQGWRLEQADLEAAEGDVADPAVAAGGGRQVGVQAVVQGAEDRKSTGRNASDLIISYAVVSLN